MKLSVKAIFQSARTTIDGGWRISFDLGQHESDFVSQLPSIMGKELYLVIVGGENENSPTVSADIDEPSICDEF
jgi:hypothetical protein